MTQPLPWEKNTAAPVPPAPEPVPAQAEQPAPEPTPAPEPAQVQDGWGAYSGPRPKSVR